MVGIRSSLSRPSKNGSRGNLDDPGCSMAYQTSLAMHTRTKMAARDKCTLLLRTDSRLTSPKRSKLVPRFDVPSDTQIRSEHGTPNQARDPGRSRRIPFKAANIPGLTKQARLNSSRIHKKSTHLFGAELMTPFPHRCAQGGGGRRSSHWQIGK